MSDIFLNYVSINPADDHARYPRDSDLLPQSMKTVTASWLPLPLLQGEEFRLLLHRLFPAWFPLFLYLLLYIPMLRCWQLLLQLSKVVLLGLAPVAIDTTHYGIRTACSPI
jgi:hypothetical protein